MTDLLSGCPYPTLALPRFGSAEIPPLCYVRPSYALELTHQIIQAARSAEAQGRRLIFFDPDDEFDQTELADLLPIEAQAGLPLPPPPQPASPPSPPASAGATFAELFQRSTRSK